MGGWTKPRTWVDGETVVGSILNTHLRDNLEFLHDRDRVHAVQTQSNWIKDNEWECMKFGGEAFDRGGMHSNRKRQAQIKVRDDGLYLLIFKIAFEDDGAGTGDRQVMLRRNSNQNDDSGHNLGMWRNEAFPGSTVYVDGSTLTRLRRGDHVNLFVKQNSGDRLRALAASSSTSFFQAVQMGG